MLLACKGDYGSQQHQPFFPEIVTPGSVTLKHQNIMENSKTSSKKKLFLHKPLLQGGGIKKSFFPQNSGKSRAC